MHAKKKKFKPVITRVRLNPEQAVLTCSCYKLWGAQTRVLSEKAGGPIYWNRQVCGWTFGSGAKRTGPSVSAQYIDTSSAVS